MQRTTAFPSSLAAWPFVVTTVLAVRAAFITVPLLLSEYAVWLFVGATPTLLGFLLFRPTPAPSVRK
jgi:hypothetical protein